jgi:uncharacterized membrane protein
VLYFFLAKEDVDIAHLCKVQIHCIHRGEGRKGRFHSASIIYALLGITFIVKIMDILVLIALFTEMSNCG